jgi:hypothetical protein
MLALYANPFEYFQGVSLHVQLRCVPFTPHLITTKNIVEVPRFDN